MRIDGSGEESLRLVRLVVVVYHASKLVIVFADSFILGDFLTTRNNFKRFHVKVILQRKMDIYLAGPHQQLFQLHVL